MVRRGSAALRRRTGEVSIGPEQNQRQRTGDERNRRHGQDVVVAAVRGKGAAKNPQPEAGAQGKETVERAANVA
ncbi:MAG: hypothetical protein MJE77_34390 [Proteobacteria bacterium]|nr:hypothetical protein [Pseudomonadota bacterium]